MSLICSISGTTPEEPVISKSGYVYEKRLLVKHLKANGTDPVTKQEMTLDDITPIKVNPAIRPRPASATSIPGLLSSLQNEWDSLMLEVHSLKQQKEAQNREMSQLLYKSDASMRVIARLMKERDDARRALAETKANLAAALQSSGAAAPAPAASMDVDSQGGITAEDNKKIDATSARLSAGRKAFVKGKQAQVAPGKTLEKFSATASHPLHSSSEPGILCLDVSPSDEKVVATGGVDGNAIVFNTSSGKILDTLKHHKKRVNDVVFAPSGDVLLTSSADATVGVWSKNASSGKFELKSSLTDHKGEVSNVSVHPSGEYFISASTDRSWAFYDLKTATLKQQFSDDKIEGGYTRAVFHPDGIIFGAGTTDSLVRIWDLKQKKNVAIFKGHTGAVTGVSFSQNGYWLSTADENGVVKLWDLRRLQNFHTIQLPEVTSVRYVDFDQSGTYLATAGNDVRIYATKGWEPVVTLSDHKAEVTSLRFGANAASLFTTSKDRTLKVWSA